MMNARHLANQVEHYQTSAEAGAVSVAQAVFSYLQLLDKGSLEFHPAAEFRLVSFGSTCTPV